MRLELCSFQVRKATLGSASQLIDGTLIVNKEEIIAMLSRDPNLKRVDVGLAHPGERCRIVHVIDVIEPRFKVSGPGCAFPGFLGPPRSVGEGRTHRLAGVAVVETAEFPTGGRGVLIAREEVIDMAGPAAPFSPFSQTINLVLSFEPKEGISIEEYEASIRMAALKTAAYLAQLSQDLKPDLVQTLELTSPGNHMPRVAYVYQLDSSGTLRHTFFYGQEIPGQLATFVHPNELVDGALVGSKSTMGVETFVHCNNPVVRELYHLHGKELDFAGVVMTVGGQTTGSNFSKERAAHHVVRLLKHVGAEGAVLTQEGGGNSIMDQMLICQACEEAGIKTVVLAYEMGGSEGIDVPLIYAVPQADAIVSLGNREEKVSFPPMERVLGGDTALLGTVKATDSFDIHLNYVKAAVNQAGFGHLRGWDY